MRNFLKNRSFSFWVIVIIMFVSASFFFFGFRITYPQSLESSWGAIDAIGGWLSAISAMVAIAVAIVVANRQNEIAKKQNEIASKQANIAEHQNRIALFEKRFEYYDIVQTCITVGNFLPNTKDAKAAVSLIVASFETEHHILHIENDRNAAYIKAHAIDAYDRVYKVIRCGEFLFEFETAEYLLPLVDALLEIVNMNGTDKEQRYYRFAYTQYAKKVDAELLPQIRNSLMQTRPISYL